MAATRVTTTWLKPATKLVLATVALLLLVAPAGAVATNTLPLTTSWQDLGTGPLQIQTNNQSQTIYQIGDSAPAAGASGFFLQGIGVPQTVNTSSHVYVRIRQATEVSGKAVSAALVYAPVSAASGSGSGTSTVQATQGTITNPTDVSCAANTLCTVSSATSRKYLSVVNTSASGVCRLGYGITPTATRGDPLNSAVAAGGQGGTRTFETVFVPNGAVQAVCTTASTIAVLEGN